MVNKIDDGSATLDFKDFCLVIKEKIMDMDTETHFKDTFRVFSKDEEGCIPAHEMKFVLQHLPGKVTYKEIDEMIETVDRNGVSFCFASCIFWMVSSVMFMMKYKSLLQLQIGR